MAYEKVAVLDRGMHFYIGLSSDTKPEALSIPMGSKFYESDTDETYIIGASGAWVLNQTDFKSIAGEERAESKYGSTLRTTQACKTFRYAFGDGDVTVYDGPCRLLGVFVKTAFATAGITLDDGSNNAILDFPVAILTAGANFDFPGVPFETSLTLDHDFGGTTSAGECFIFYDPARFSD